MAADGKYTAADLARLAGVSLRTVRYYVREGLIDAPLGRGRGAHFAERHLHQLIRAKWFQHVGLDNTAIRQHADDLERILSERGLTVVSATKLWASAALSGLVTLRDKEATPAIEDDEELDVSTAIRIPMAPGIELLVSRDIKMPTPRRLVEIALYVRRMFRLG